jgi:hypothetical protein
MSPFRDWKTRRWILKPKGISKQAEKVSVKGGGRRRRTMSELTIPDRASATTEGGMLRSAKRMPRQERY